MAPKPILEKYRPQPESSPSEMHPKQFTDQRGCSTKICVP